MENLIEQLPTPTILMWDFNAHIAQSADAVGYTGCTSAVG